MSTKRILVAMSGGIDSAVAAALLKTQGYDVIGVHMQLWKSDIPKSVLPVGNCCVAINPNDVRKLCQQIEIPFHLVQAHEQFENDVIDYVVSEYLEARLPNPCVKCTTSLKFSHLIQKANELKCDLVATGHYAKVVKNPDGTETNLYRAVDRVQDQSHFLFDLKQPDLVRTIMPIGDLLKSNVLKMAETFGITAPERPSTGGARELCFVGDRGYLELLRQRTPDRYRPYGPIIDKEGHILGRHTGIYQFSVGQTRSHPDIDKPGITSLYVVGFDTRINAIIMGPKTDLEKKGLVVVDCNWIGLQDFSKGLRVQSKIALNPKEVGSRITLLGSNSVLVDFEESTQGIVAGQSIVFYQDDLVVGGGWIEALTDPIQSKMQLKQAAFTAQID